MSCSGMTKGVNEISSFKIMAVYFLNYGASSLLTSMKNFISWP